LRTRLAFSLRQAKKRPGDPSTRSRSRAMDRSRERSRKILFHSALAAPRRSFYLLLDPWPRDGRDRSVCRMSSRIEQLEIDCVVGLDKVTCACGAITRGGDSEARIPLRPFRTGFKAAACLMTVCLLASFSQSSQKRRRSRVTCHGFASPTFESWHSRVRREADSERLTLSLALRCVN
jgi:hypothetical protein